MRDWPRVRSGSDAGAHDATRRRSVTDAYFCFFEAIVCTNEGAGVEALWLLSGALAKLEHDPTLRDERRNSVKLRLLWE